MSGFKEEMVRAFRKRIVVEPEEGMKLEIKMGNRKRTTV